MRNAFPIIRHVFESNEQLEMSITLYRQQGGAPSQEPFFWRGIYTGIKYQCVELARRYYLMHYGLLISDVPNAKDLFPQRTLFNIRTGMPQYWPAELNIGTKLPSPGSLLIWMPTKDFPLSGHVAVVTQVTKNYVYVIEQNYGTGRRRLPVRNGKIVSPGLIGWKDVPTLF
jgi:hypothetical protein